MDIVRTKNGVLGQINGGQYSPPLIHVPEPGDFDPRKVNSAYEGHVEGTCLVIGSAPCVFDDVDAALATRPDADLCVINEACQAYQARFLASCHPEKMAWFQSLNEKRWGRAVETDYMTQHKPGAGFKPDPRWYHYRVTSGAGSAAFAAKIMFVIGFEEVILCGCPLVGGDGYFNDTSPSTPQCARVGWEGTRHALIEGWQRGIVRIAKQPTIEGRLFSMSGFTQKHLGAPPDDPVRIDH